MFGEARSHGGKGLQVVGVCFGDRDLNVPTAKVKLGKRDSEEISLSFETERSLRISREVAAGLRFLLGLNSRNDQEPWDLTTTHLSR